MEERKLPHRDGLWWVDVQVEKRKQRAILSVLGTHCNWEGVPTKVTQPFFEWLGPVAPYNSMELTPEEEPLWAAVYAAVLASSNEHVRPPAAEADVFIELLRPRRRMHFRDSIPKGLI